MVSGVLNDELIFAGVTASAVSGALEGFVRAAAIELSKGLRINVVSPTSARGRTQVPKSALTPALSPEEPRKLSGQEGEWPPVPWRIGASVFAPHQQF